MNFECKYWKAKRISYAKNLQSSSEILPRFCRWKNSSPPGQ